MYIKEIFIVLASTKIHSQHDGTVEPQYLAPINQLLVLYCITSLITCLSLALKLNIILRLFRTKPSGRGNSSSPSSMDTGSVFMSEKVKIHKA